MTIVVTGATGQLGGLVVKHLLDRVSASEITGTVRDLGKAAKLSQESGISLRQGDFDRPETLPYAFDGADKLLIISTNGDTATRLRQHTAAVSAAKQAGVGRIFYTSITAADTTKIMLADTHRPTEEVIKASGIPFAFLRNNWYFENDLGTIEAALSTGKIVTSSGQGKFAPATRDDFAHAAAAALTLNGQENSIYELGNITSYGYADWAEAISQASGKKISHLESTPDEVSSTLIGAGAPKERAEIVVDFYAAVKRNELDVSTSDLEELIGKPPTSLAEFVTSAIVHHRNDN
jgi:NAD(P)H dehydrogenase (quinone)